MIGGCGRGSQVVLCSIGVLVCRVVGLGGEFRCLGGCGVAASSMYWCERPVR